jgi:hypothetical protein
MKKTLISSVTSYKLQTTPPACGRHPFKTLKGIFCAFVLSPIRPFALFCLLLSAFCLPNMATAQTYHADDKEALRAFLRQSSATAGQSNAQQLGLSDTSAWYANELWVSQVPNLTWNTATPNRLTKINHSFVWANKNLAGNLDVSQCTALEHLNFGSNKLTSVNVTGATALKELHCYSNLLQSIDVSSNAVLEKLICDYNQIATINVSNHTALERVQCDQNQLTSINVNGCTALISLACAGNLLTNLDVSSNTALIELRCSNNQLDNLDVSNNAALGYFLCADNLLESLDVSSNTALEYFECSMNPLSTLTIGNHPELIYFLCGGTLLESMNLSGLTAAQMILCNQNKLTSLNVNGLTALERLECQNNQLTNLNISNCTGIKRLSCQDNHLLLSELYAIFDRLYDNGATQIRLGPQHLPPPLVEINVPFAFSPSQDAFGNASTVITVAGAELNYHYKLSCDTITFLLPSLGNTYTVTMSNGAIYSDPDYPADVIYEATPAIPYAENDVEMLRRFLRQPSAVAGEINAERLGLSISDTTHWHTNKTWVTQVTGTSWANTVPARLKQINWHYSYNLAGSLDVSNCTGLEYLNCSWNDLTNLNVSNCTALENLSTETNHFHLSDLYAASERLKANGGNVNDRHLGNQELPRRYAAVDVMLAFTTPQNEFGGVTTTYSVTDSITSAVVPESPTTYTLNNGNITFHTAGKIYEVIMSNEAIITNPDFPAKTVFNVEVKETLSDDASLSSLTVSEGTLMPIFSSTIYDYTVNVVNAIASIEIAATATDENAVLSGDIGTHALTVGDNLFTITVTAEDGITKQNYEVTVTRNAPNTPVYQVTVTANNETYGTATGGGTYEENATATVRATANTGYKFINWTKEGVVVSSNNPYSFTVTADITLVANFVAEDVNTYSVNISVNNETYGTATGGGTYEENATATVTATANTGYKFINWTKDGVEVSTNITYSFTVVEDVELVANFEEEVGIDELRVTSYELRVYPNPTTGELTIDMGSMGYEIMRCEICDIYGRIVSYNQVSNLKSQNLISVNISHLPTGVYFLQVATEQGILTKKVVKN